MLTGPGSVFTVATDELRAQNVHRTLDESLNKDFVFTREKFRFPGLFPRPLERKNAWAVSHDSFSYKQ